MSTLAQYVKDNVFLRCGHAVSELCDAGLLARPESASSEAEIYEWWLVSADLADKLTQAGQSVVRFHELNLWGRGASGGDLTQDGGLRTALAAQFAGNS